jgi:segregation and condensation protein B
MEPEQLRRIIESVLLAYGQPLTIEKLQTLFVDDTRDIEQQSLPSLEEITSALELIQQQCEGHGYELKKVSSGWRYQVRAEMAPWVNKLWEEKPQRYSRALLETLAIIAYRQPITRGDIEEIRGVAVSSHIIKTLVEREWVKVVGQRDVPGRPSLYATTRQFLDYFNLDSLDELPSLRELADIDSLTPQLDLQGDDELGQPDDDAADEMIEGPEFEIVGVASADAVDVLDQTDDKSADNGSDNNEFNTADLSDNVEQLESHRADN